MGVNRLHRRILNMKWIITILLFVSIGTEAQMMPNGSDFIYSAAVSASPASYNNAGTLVFNRKSYTNLDAGTNSGYNLRIQGTGNLTFINCIFGPSISNGITVEGFTGTVRFINCLYVSNRVSIEFSGSSGGSVQVDGGWVINPWGAPVCKGQFIQFESVSTPDSYVRRLKGKSFRGEGNTEDWVSMYASYGTTNPIRIEDNFFEGGGPSASGGGIMSGDTDGGNQVVQRNKLKEVGNYLFAIASGEDITVTNNMAWQSNDGVSTIAMYVYGGQNGATTCADHEMSNNSINFWNPSNLFYGGDGSPGEDCGDIIGIGSGYVADGNAAWLETNDNDLTATEFNFPVDLINCVGEDVLWQLRDESTQFSDEGGCKNADQRSRPTATGAGGGLVFNSFATLTVSGGTTYRWVLVSGPNVPGMSGATSSSLSLTGLTNGKYRFRVEAYDGDGASDADWVEIEVELT
jgi:hypothetical protein